jgi:Family of unknown function (DUF6273)
VQQVNLLELGAYPQSSLTGGTEPIVWRILDRSNDDLLLVSDRILDCKRYHGDFVDTTWRDSDLRAWLNDEFFDKAFDRAERKMIQPTACSGNGEGTPDTVDRVFLLSVNEIRMFTDPKHTSTRRRAAIGTEYARAPKDDGCRLYVYDKSVEKDYLVIDGEKVGCSWWWTRSQPQAHAGTSPRAAFIGARGDVKSYGRVNLAGYGVRPAVTLRRSPTVILAP